jgi:thiosulfate/3-mercaptopyruvate sulfurtransferase
MRINKLNTFLLLTWCLFTASLSIAQQQAARTVPAPARWSTLITAKALHEKLGHKDLLIIDARSPAEYAAGHIPGAINLPGADWRTPAAAPGQVGQKIFRQADGSLDVKRYEEFLSKAGVKPEHEIVVYGNHAGKADGSIPAAILLKLGHQQVSFLDGIGLDEWKTAGYPISKEATQRPVSQYVAHADASKLWSAEDVIKNIENPDVVIIDSRTPAEFAGEDLRGNKRGGHIPGAILLNSEDFLDSKTHKTIDAEEARKRIEAEIPKDKTVVIYCQSGTRCSHKELILKDLGYKNVVLYDSSWQEWGNRLDTPIENPGEATTESK